MPVRFDQFWIQLLTQLQHQSQLAVENSTALRDRLLSYVTPQPPPPEEPRRIGLALGGGGGKGGAHLGVLSVLEDQHVPVDMIAGTSIGGAVGVFYAAGFSLQEIQDIFRAMAMRKIATTDPTRTGFIGSARREAMLNTYLGERTFADLKLPCAVVAADLITGQAVVINEGPLVPAVMATTALPGVFPPVLHQDGLLVDGGVVNNLPIEMAMQLGAQKVIAVQLRDASDGLDTLLDVPDNPISRLMLAPRQFAVANRALSVLIDQLTERQMAQYPPTIHLTPDVGQIPLLDMTQPEHGVRAGVQAAEDVIGQLRELRAWRLGEPAPDGPPAQRQNAVK